MPGVTILGERLRQSLTERHSRHLYRQTLLRDPGCGLEQVIDGRLFVNFCSNDYLGLSHHPDVVAALIRGAKEYGVGSGASHLVTGHCRVHEQLCEELADFCGRDRVMLFSTGYMANIGVINALTRPDDLVCHDALNHASLLDGGWLSRAESKRYPHVDLESLSNMLGNFDRRRTTESMALVVTDGVFSMDGDCAPLADLADLALHHDAVLMVDDAHGIGCLGPQGRGVVADAGLTQQQVPVLVGTFGKAFGTAGAFVSGDDLLIDYLTQFARTYVFTTAMSPALAEATRTSLALLRQEHWRRARLQELIERFRTTTLMLGLKLLPGNSPVQALMLGDAATAQAVSQLLKQRGLQVSAIRPPTVPVGQSRLRITLSAVHSDEHLQRLLDALAEVAEYLQDRA
ncbi:8-amino-7-oxononanoate synthase [Pseudohongiella spirulinae]|uniref:8-amino-7-oxononanoate synthase n=1 Tax=Pseudohongiella spirulinae TaxID=1249552 RepID=A0A0S2KGA4_9GAMM|nr:8-amino-7-oxononanoate synthase [Pseudohongiella spirulinae]